MGQEENKPAQEDTAWFEALSGKTEAGQGARLRRMLRETELSDAVQEDLTHDWQRLQFALRREAAQESKTGSNLRYFALAASLLIFTISLSMLMPMNEVPYQSRSVEGMAVMRGVSEQVVFSAAPSQDAKQLEAELIRLGVKVLRRETSEKVSLHIPLSRPVRNEVRTALEARVIPIPDQGDLTVVFILATQ